MGGSRIRAHMDNERFPWSERRDSTSAYRTSKRRGAVRDSSAVRGRVASCGPRWQSKPSRKKEQSCKPLHRDLHALFARTTTAPVALSIRGSAGSAWRSGGLLRDMATARTGIRVLISTLQSHLPWVDCPRDVVPTYVA